MLCALIQNNLVVDVKDLSASQIESVGSFYEAIVNVAGVSPAPQVGWTYDGVSLSPPGWRITKLGIRQRFTMTELINITKASNPTDSTYQPVVQVLMGNLSVATFVDLKRPDTIGGFNLLVTMGLLTQARCTAILTTPPGPSEVYLD